MGLWISCSLVFLLSFSASICRHPKAKKMVKVIQPNIPPAYQELWDKIFRYFERYGVPIWCRNWFQNMVSSYQQREKASRLKPIAASWKALSSSTKAVWRNAAYVTWGYYRGYRLFTADWNFRVDLGLSVPATPSMEHQLQGLKIKNAGGSANIFARYDCKDLVGQFDVNFNFKKIERTPSGTYAFKVQTTAYYFTSGGTGVQTDVYTAPSGNSNWGAITRTIGTAGRKYFHVVIIFTIQNYDADVYLDNFKITDSVGLIYKETWDTLEGAEWEFQRRVRKQGWQFNPSYALPYFEHSYLE